MNLRDWLPFLSSNEEESSPAEPATGLSPIPSTVVHTVADTWPADFSREDLEYTLNAVQDYAIRAFGPAAYSDANDAPNPELAGHPIAELVHHPEQTSDLEELFHTDEDGVEGYIVTAERWDTIKADLEMSDLALEAVQEAHRAYALELGYGDYSALTKPLFIATDNPPALKGDVADDPTTDDDQVADTATSNDPAPDAPTPNDSGPDEGDSPDKGTEPEMELDQSGANSSPAREGSRASTTGATETATNPNTASATAAPTSTKQANQPPDDHTGESESESEPEPDSGDEPSLDADSPPNLSEPVQTTDTGETAGGDNTGSEEGPFIFGSHAAPETATANDTGDNRDESRSGTNDNDDTKGNDTTDASDDKTFDELLEEGPWVYEDDAETSTDGSPAESDSTPDHEHASATPSPSEPTSTTSESMTVDDDQDSDEEAVTASEDKWPEWMLTAVEPQHSQTDT